MVAGALTPRSADALSAPGGPGKVVSHPERPAEVKRIFEQEPSEGP